MSEHTPGPWGHFRLPGTTKDDQKAYLARCVDAGEGDFYVVMCEKADGPADVCHAGNGPTSQANAILIAAAPDLLAALKWALAESGCDGDLCMHEWHDAARAAVARAEGKGEGT